MSEPHLLHIKYEMWDWIACFGVEAMTFYLIEVNIMGFQFLKFYLNWLQNKFILWSKLYILAYGFLVKLFMGSWVKFFNGCLVLGIFAAWVSCLWSILFAMYLVCWIMYFQLWIWFDSYPCCWRNAYDWSTFPASSC